ncbi:MAG TPA: hypothetical protein VIG06_19815 [Kofleriaceae bacterium]
MMVLLSSLAAGACASDEGGDEAESTVEVGYVGEQGFRPIEPGDPCWVSEAEMAADLTLRTEGMVGDAGTITCALFDDELGAISYWHSQRLFVDAGDGARQVTVRLRLDGAEGFAQIDGRAATLQCEVADEGGIIGDRLVDVVLTAAQ